MTHFIRSCGRYRMRLGMIENGSLWSIFCCVLDTKGDCIHSVPRLVNLVFRSLCFISRSIDGQHGVLKTRQITGFFLYLLFKQDLRTVTLPTMDLWSWSFKYLTAVVGDSRESKYINALATFFFLSLYIYFHLVSLAASFY